MITMPDSSEKLTPMLNQYLQIKQDYPDCIMFFRLGDFYEMFFEDAVTASKVLNIALTSREAGRDRRVPMCGVPFHAADNYLARLIRAGHKVAICEQTEDPRFAKGIVKREIIRVVTPGTVLSPVLLNDQASNFIIALNRDAGTFGLSYVELSTGEFKLTEVSSLEMLFDELSRLSPSEIVFPESWQNNGGLVAKIKGRVPALASFVPDRDFEPGFADEKIKAHFRTRTTEGFGSGDMPLALAAAAALLQYLERTQKTKLTHITHPGTYNLTDFMVMDAATQRNLEIVKTSDGQSSSGTLFYTLNQTRTAMGSRLLAQWLLQPLINSHEINQRLEATAELHDNNALREELTNILKPCLDIARIAGRVSMKIANARDLIGLRHSLDIIPVLKEKLSGANAQFLKNIAMGLDPLEDVRGLLNYAIHDDPPLSVREGNLIKAGFDSRIDELRGIINHGRDWVLNLQKEEIKRTGVNSLKIRYNRVFGYYIEITKANLGSVPQDYLRKQTLANAERFTTPGLTEFESRILGAEEQIAGVEYDVFCGILEQVSAQIERIKATARLMAMVDVILSFAAVAAQNSYIRPRITDDDLIDIKAGRHPVLEGVLTKGRFIANDLYLDKKENQILVITGPNMAGKSTYIRQAALLVLMAQVGSFIPAEEATIGVVDRIFSRIGASDALASGMSTFMVEMAQTANILNNATPKSLIILDEIGRGTSTFDGLSIAWAVVEYLHDNPKTQAKTLFATHYHELTEANIMLKRVKNFNVAVKEWQDEIIFLYKVVAGSCDHSFGIHVGKLAGLPQSVISRSREILQNLEAQSISYSGTPTFARKSKTGSSREERQLDLFGAKLPGFCEDLKKLDINSLTPLEALTKLSEYKKELEKSG